MNAQCSIKPTYPPFHISTILNKKTTVTENSNTVLFTNSLKAKQNHQQTCQQQKCCIVHKPIERNQIINKHHVTNIRNVSQDHQQTSFHSWHQKCLTKSSTSIISPTAENVSLISGCMLHETVCILWLCLPLSE